MKIALPEDKDEKIDLTAMVDIVFLLIIFFMVVGTVLTKEKIPMDMAIAEEAIIPKETQGRLLLNVTVEGKLYVGMHEIQVADIGGYIEGAREINPNPKVYLRADRNAHYQYIRDVLKECATHGVPDVIFGVTQVDASPNRPATTNPSS